MQGNNGLSLLFGPSGDGYSQHDQTGHHHHDRDRCGCGDGSHQRDAHQEEYQCLAEHKNLPFPHDKQPCMGN